MALERELPSPRATGGIGAAGCAGLTVGRCLFCLRGLFLLKAYSCWISALALRLSLSCECQPDKDNKKLRLQ